MDDNIVTEPGAGRKISNVATEMAQHHEEHLFIFALLVRVKAPGRRVSSPEHVSIP